jgi:chromosome partitioning protein
MVIAVLNQKGGVGKTTLSIHIAAGLALRGKRTLLIDADVQASALEWAENRQDDLLFPVVGIPKATIHREVRHLAADYDAVVIDGPPRVNEVARSAILASDLVLIPVQPSPYDVWAVKDIVDLLTEASVFKENIKSVFAVNRKIVNTALGRDVAEALADHHMPVLDSVISQRVVFAESAATGRTVLEIDNDSPASREITALIDEILEVMKK